MKNIKTGIFYLLFGAVSVVVTLAFVGSPSQHKAIAVTTSQDAVDVLNKYYVEGWRLDRVINTNLETISTAKDNELIIIFEK